MRNIRVADRKDWVFEPVAPTPPPRHHRSSRARDWLATLPVLLLVPVLIFPFVSTSAGSPTLQVRGDLIPGESVLVVGRGFGPEISGDLAWGEGGDDIARFQADRQGKFQVPVTLPSLVPDNKLELISRDPTGTVLATVELKVGERGKVSGRDKPKATPTPKPTTAPDVATETGAPPTAEPTQAAEATPVPTTAPTATATTAPTASPTAAPTPKPTATPVPVAPATGSILIDRATLMSLPTSGTAWSALKARADLPAGAPNLSDQDDPNDVTALAKALVYARTGITSYRDDVVRMLKAAVGTEYPGDTLGIARGVAPLVLAADLVGWRDPAWMNWLDNLRTWKNPDREYTLISMHEKRPNNWGTHAGAGRIAAAIYLGDSVDLARAARVFRGYLGDRASYASFTYGDDLSWQSNRSLPVGINPVGSSLDGIMPDDMRRGGTAPSVGDLGQSYTWEALQGTVLQAELLSRRGYDAWGWEDKAVLRAFSKINALGYPAVGDDRWQPWLVNERYGRAFPVSTSTTAGKSFGYADWLYGS